MDHTWAEEVRAAVLTGDRASLARLFEAAVAVEGRTRASRSWLDAISGFDADAVTG